MNGVYETNTDCSFIRGMVENYCTLGKIQPCPQCMVEFHLEDDNFPPFPSRAVNIRILCAGTIGIWNRYQGHMHYWVCFIV